MSQSEHEAPVPSTPAPVAWMEAAAARILNCLFHELEDHSSPDRDRIAKRYAELRSVTNFSDAASTARHEFILPALPDTTPSDPMTMTTTTPALAMLGGCDCYGKAPTVPVYRDRMNHLDDCPAKGSGYPVGTMRAHVPATRDDGVSLIAAERKRQITKEGWTPGHDDTHSHGEMAITAACYAVNETDAEVLMHGEDAWPWGSCDDKRKRHDRVRQLTIAGALIAAEIDRLQRAQSAGVSPSEGSAPDTTTEPDFADQNGPLHAPGIASQFPPSAPAPQEDADPAGRPRDTRTDAPATDARGFGIFCDFKDGRNARVRVKQSSAAHTPHLWIFVEGGDYERVNDGSAHLTLDEAAQVRDALDAGIAFLAAVSDTPDTGEGTEDTKLSRVSSSPPEGEDTQPENR